jgi:hypothetical protein
MINTISFYLVCAINGVRAHVPQVEELPCD